MSTSVSKTMYWTPRVLCILFIAFVSMFALDVFEERFGFWQTIAALAIHLIPSFVLVLLLVIAWRWEWVGALAFAFCALVFLIIVRGTWPVKLLFAIPCVLVASLFLADWRTRHETHAH